MKDTFKNKYLKKQKDLSQISITPSFPSIVKIDVCNTCNYTCLFCPQAKQTDKIGCIDTVLCKKIIYDAYEAGARELCLSMTGEPLLNLDLEEYIVYAKNMGYNYIFFNTNGYLLSPERGASLIAAGIDSIKISVNSSQKNYQLVHGLDAFEKVVSNIKAFDECRKKYESQCKLYVSYVAVKQTLGEIEQLRDCLTPYVDEIIVMNANNRGGSVSDFEECLYVGQDEYAFQYPCSQLFNNCYVTAEGYMIICCQDFENLTVVADLHKESIKDAWNNKKFTEFRKRYLNRDIEGTLCDNCINNTCKPVVPLTEEVAYYKISDTKLQNLHDRIELLDQTMA